VPTALNESQVRVEAAICGDDAFEVICENNRSMNSVPGTDLRMAGQQVARQRHLTRRDGKRVRKARDQDVEEL